MSDSLRWLLGVDSLRFGQEGVEFAFEHPLPAWAWALLVLGACVLAVLAYRRLEGSAPARMALGALRALLLVLLAVLISGPRLIKPNESEERDWVLVLVDRSQSMNVPDAPVGGDRAPREQQLRMALEAARPTWQALGAERVLVWLGFDGGTYELPTTGAGMPVLSDPIGRRTDIDRAIDQALRRGAGRPLSGVVLLSDGRSVSQPGKQLLRRLESEKVPVFTVALGSAEAVADVGVRRVDAPRSAFVNDLVPVQVEVQRTPAAMAGMEDASRVSVLELVDDATGAVLDRAEVDWGAGDVPAPTNSGAEPASSPSAPATQSRKVTLTARTTAAGSSKWQVRARPQAGGADMIAENNASDLAIELVDRPLRVAVLDGYPRWEYRFLTSLLVREQSMSSVIMLLAPGRKYLQEGTIVLDALPTTHEQWKAFDVIVMGDVLPSVFTPEQLEQIKQRVAIGGAGLVWIAGESATPALWRGTALGDLLPLTPGEGTGGPAQGSQDVFGAPVLVRPTPAAERLGVLRLADAPTNGMYWPPVLTDASVGWPLLYWMQRIEARQLKPAAEALALAYRPDAGPGDATPAVIAMRFGAGRSVYVATDEIWRWRYGRGELLPERFWLQIIRLLGRDSLARSGRPALIETSPPNPETGQAVRVSVTLLDQALVDAAPPSVQVRVRRLGATAEDGAGDVELTLAPEGSTSGEPAARSGATRTYAATLIAGETGRYRAEAPDPVLSPGGGAALSTLIEVWQPDDELRQPQTDHALLGRLAQGTGGRVLTPEQMNQLPKLLPNRKVRLTGEPDVDTLWDSPLALILVIGLLAAEWVGRRLLRLV